MKNYVIFLVIFLNDQGGARSYGVAAMVLNRLIKKRQLANLIIKNMKKSKSGNHHRDEFDWEKHCRSTFPTPAAFVKFYKLTPNEFDSLRDKIAVFARRQFCITLR